MKRTEALAVVALMMVFVALVLWNAWTTSATVDEPIHLSAGYTYLAWHDYRLNAEHPPLVKLVAALPLLTMPLGLDGFDPEGVDGRATDDAVSRGTLRREWANALGGIGWWRFAHEFFYGAKDSLLIRMGVSRTVDLPMATVYSRAGFVRDAEAMLRAARVAVLPFAVLLGLLVFLWARELHGFKGGLLALTLFCFDPSFIANSALVTTDVAAALGFFGATYAFWRATRCLTWANVAGLCLAVAIAVTVKFSTLLLVPIFIVLGVVVVVGKSDWTDRIMPNRALDSRSRRSATLASLFVAAAFAGVLALWAVYQFRFSAAENPARAAEQEARLAPQLSSIPFRTPGTLPFLWSLRRGAAHAALQVTNTGDIPLDVRNKLAMSMHLGASDTLLIAIHDHHLLPESFVTGLATLRQTMFRGAYLNGEYSSIGFHSYFLWCFVLKTPLVTLALLALALVWFAQGRMSLGGAVWFLAVPVVVYLVVSLQSPINIGQRHLLPLFPFLYVGIAGLARFVEHESSRWKRAVAILVPLSIALSAFVVVSPRSGVELVAPHHLSYFNELAGGPAAGAQHLVDSNIDWGQDLPALREWMTNHGVTEPINLCYFGSADPRFHGIPSVNLEGGFGNAEQQSLSSAKLPGYFAVSETSVHLAQLPPPVRERWSQFLRTARPVGRAGYSIVIYRRDPP